ncbi:DegT/DnrJ/EryC1/StrS family aminotransferase [Dehalococcoidia bacterium]|nr:DegT/DnrJ/EryC1/StrS family aminotransferase [Dehalococcoidia bacterium]
MKPAILGGHPIFPEAIPFTQPTLPSYDSLEPGLRDLFGTAMITNGRFVRELEGMVESGLGVKHAVGLSSCTSGLLLAWKALNVRAGGEVILPSFTFSATGHALIWNGLVPRFVDIEPDTFLMSPTQVKEAITERTVGICAVHTFGNPCYPDQFESIARDHQLKLVFDSAHALGTSYHGSGMGGFGDIEVFSLSPTKLVVAAEGGLATTNNKDMARLLRIGRDYGNPGDYNCEFAGLSARMSEIHGLLAIETYRSLLQNVERRLHMAQLYQHHLSNVPGISFQKIIANSTTTYKDCAILIDETEFGISRDDLAQSLQTENISTRKYFSPPLHKQDAYTDLASNTLGNLPITERVCNTILCLPMYSHMEAESVARVCEAIVRIYEQRAEIKTYFSNHKP